MSIRSLNYFAVGAATQTFRWITPSGEMAVCMKRTRRVQNPIVLGVIPVRVACPRVSKAAKQGEKWSGMAAGKKTRQESTASRTRRQ